MTSNTGDLQPTDWGWQLDESDELTPIKTDKPYAPEKLINVVSSACKVSCTNRCSCVRAGLPCTVMCSSCTGSTCTNTEAPTQEDLLENI